MFIQYQYPYNVREKCSEFKTKIGQKKGDIKERKYDFSVSRWNSVMKICMKAHNYTFFELHIVAAWPNLAKNICIAFFR